MEDEKITCEWCENTEDLVEDFDGLTLCPGCIKTSYTEQTDDMLKDQYRDALCETYGAIDVCGMQMDAARVLEDMDPTAFTCGFVDWLDSETGGDLVEHDNKYYRRD